MWPLIIGAVSQANKPILELGQEYQGGVIAYFWQEGEYGYVAGEQHGIIMAKDNIGKRFGDRYADTGIPDLFDDFGEGRNNTQKIVDFHTYFAGHVVARDIIALNIDGYNDWFIPTLKDYEKVHPNMEFLFTKTNWTVFAIGSGFVSRYWLSWLVYKSSTNSLVRSVLLNLDWTFTSIVYYPTSSPIYTIPFRYF